MKFRAYRPIWHRLCNSLHFFKNCILMDPWRNRQIFNNNKKKIHQPQFIVIILLLLDFFSDSLSLFKETRFHWVVLGTSGASFSFRNYENVIFAIICEGRQLVHRHFHWCPQAGPFLASLKALSELSEIIILYWIRAFWIERENFAL